MSVLLISVVIVPVPSMRIIYNHHLGWSLPCLSSLPLSPTFLSPVPIYIHLSSRTPCPPFTDLTAANLASVTPLVHLHHYWAFGLPEPFRLWLPWSLLLLKDFPSSDRAHIKLEFTEYTLHSCWLSSVYGISKRYALPLNFYNTALISFLSCNIYFP